MRRFFRILTILLALVFVSQPIWADEGDVRKSISSYVDAFNRKDLDSLAGHWAENGTYVDRETGERTTGRDAILADIKKSLSDQPEMRLTGQIESIRMIKPDVALVDGESTLSVLDQEPVISTFSAVLTMQNGKWLIDSMEEMPLPTPQPANEALQQLEWLVGTWVDASDSVRAESTFRWSQKKTFLIRSFRVETADGVVQSGTQVIGWDPRSREIRSWSFHDDGAFGNAIWSKSGDEWLVRSSETLADGRVATGTYVMVPRGTDSVQVQLVGHTLEGEPQPTRDPVTMVRVQASDAHKDS